MTNQEIIAKKFSAFRTAVRRGGSFALCEQMEDVLNMSLNLHEQLEGGYHTHHTEESDSHGWAVADGGSVVGSGASVLAEANRYGSAEEDAASEAVKDNPGQKGVFSAIMVDPFEGGTGHGDNDEPMRGEPHDSMRFEGKLQELLKIHAHQWLPTFYRKSMNTAKAR